jgi:two-component system cell cycle response regulator
MSARILIIEDNSTNMELMSYLLTAFGHTPLMAFDGECGVRVARESVPDLILCDVHLPKLDGYGVLEAIKRDPLLCKIPLLAVTALAMVGDRERLLAAGFDGYIGKPIEPERFVTELDAFLPPVAPASAPAPRPTLLIVDDDSFMLEVLGEVLQQPGYAIVTASGAGQARALLAEHDVQVILCDQCMPPTTGLALLEEARALRPDCYRIILSALADIEQPGGEVGNGLVDRYLTKPWNGAELRACLLEGFRLAAERRAASAN